MSTERTVILYHNDCPDGFGGAYAAWKKFGAHAEYLAAKHGKPPPEGLAGAHLYLIDFCYPKDTMDRLVAEAATVTVLDHHEGIKDVVEAMPEHVYDAKRSGATIAWAYFHPGEPVPELLKYVEDGDLYKFVLPDARAVLAYVYAEPFTFEHWDQLRTLLDDPTRRAEATQTGKAYAAYHRHLVEKLVANADTVSFEGYTCLFAEAPKPLHSDVGNELAKVSPPIGLVGHAKPDGFRISLRGNGSVNVADIAKKYGGNGHPNAAAFRLPWGAPLPWTPRDKN